MRPHSRFSVSRSAPEARAKCDRCQKLYQHSQLDWQFEWAGPKLVNRRLLVCAGCMDTPQQGLRTFKLPADPLPILNPRAEPYVEDNNPISSLGTSIGTLINGAGLDAAFAFGTNKSRLMSASVGFSVAGYNNWVGRNWGSGNTVGASRFLVYAPNDTAFTGATGAYRFEGSTTGIVWVTINSGTAANTVAEVIDVTTTTQTEYQYHRIVFSGDGVSSVAVAQFVIYASGPLAEGDT